jgi:hypothetical protein
VGTRKIAKALDNSDAKGAAELIRSVSSLRLLHIAQLGLALSRSEALDQALPAERARLGGDR